MFGVSDVSKITTYLTCIQNMKRLLSALFLLSAYHCFADPRLPNFFTDHMVLQRSQAIPVWGWASPNETITVTLDKQVKKIKTPKSGKWMVKFDPMEAGGPYTLTVKGNTTITLQDVLIGEVWICSGQSNMEWELSSSMNAAKEMSQADYPQIRHFKVAHAISNKPLDNVAAAQWKICNPQNTGDFTAVGYFFARDLYQKLHVPIGLLNTSWGGTHSETWTSKEAFQQSDEFKDMIAKMPTIDLDSLARRQAEEVQAKIKSMGINAEKPASSTAWAAENFNDGKWPTMALPGPWEEKGFEGLDGIVWFRKFVTIDQVDVGKPAVLVLGKIDDSDHSFVNGTEVGGMTNKWNELRSYKIPAGVLHEGKNLIAIQVEDNGGGGGIYGDSSELKLTIGNKNIPLYGDWKFQVEEMKISESGLNPNAYPTLLYNAMIQPLEPFAFAGVIWYQGEANADRAYQYRKAFPLMITDWRSKWHRDFPFYFVQLASFNAGNGDSQHGSTWAELREAQTMTLSLPNTGMAVTIDIGESNDIHPKNKQDVGKRLAALALNRTYRQPMEDTGPMYHSMKTEGNSIVLQLDSIGSGLMVKDKYGYLKGFEIAGSDKQFHYAKATIRGNEVVVSSDSVTAPVAVRYAWADDAPDANLYNKEGFPAVPFRTDNWEGVTVKNKFGFE
jgi:sialate O-acetylesterase